MLGSEFTRNASIPAFLPIFFSSAILSTNIAPVPTPFSTYNSAIKMKL
jgi:hypothetical protein